MMFIRAHVRADNGELVAAGASELLFDEQTGVSHLVRHSDGARIDVVAVDVGLAEDFDPVHLDGSKVNKEVGGCSHALHFFLRMEGDGKGGVQFKDKHASELPRVHKCPTTYAKVRALVAAKQPDTLPEPVGHWLHFMGLVGDSDLEHLGIARPDLHVELAFDAIRVRRGERSRADILKRQAEQRAFIHPDTVPKAN